MTELTGDLFGFAPVEPRQKEDKTKGFDEFWQAWPKSTRKVAKRQCLDIWARYELHAQTGHIVAHVEWMKTQNDWLKDQGAYICAPAVYLRQERWSEWEQPKPRKEEPTALQQILAHKGAPMPADVRAKLAQLRGRT